MDAIGQAQNLMQAYTNPNSGLGKLPSFPVATLPGGNMLNANGQTSQAPATAQMQNLQQNILGTGLNPQGLLGQIQQYMQPVNLSLPPMPGSAYNSPVNPNQSQTPSGQTYALSANNPGAVLNQIADNANVNKNSPTYSLFNESTLNQPITQDPIQSYFQNMLRNNPTIQSALQQDPTLGSIFNNEPVGSLSAQMANYSGQNNGLLPNPYLDNLKNINISVQNQQIPDITMYGGANAFNNRIH